MENTIVNNSEHAMVTTESHEMVTVSGMEITASGVQNDIEYAYVLNERPIGEIKIRASIGNQAWWTKGVKHEEGRQKVSLLFSGFRQGFTVEDACAFAGITKGQYKYFKTIHPELVGVKDIFQQLPLIRAQQAVYKDLDAVETAKWFLSKRHKAFKSREAKVDDDEGLTIVQNNTQNNVTVVKKEIDYEKLARLVAIAMGGDRAQLQSGSGGDGGGGVRDTVAVEEPVPTGQ